MQPQTIKYELDPCKVIKESPVIHCKRGPQNCAKCKEVWKISYALLDICPDGDYARPMTEVEINGEKRFCVYDVIMRFDSKEEAKKYAEEHGITFED